MKKLIERIGIDKFAHLGIGGLICAMLTIALTLIGGKVEWSVMWHVALASLLVFVVSLIKEDMDDTFDWWDIVAAMIGCALIATAIAIGITLHFAIH